jgi:hypothetical protein
MKSYFGNEYPAAITIDGVRLPLVSERRWARIYVSKEPSMGSEVSRFMDGSAAISFAQFASEWPTWSECERRDFCSACSWLHEQTDYPDMLRYIMQHGGPDDWSALANAVGSRLPQGEAFDLLTRALRSTDLGNASNISQGISLTRHPEAESVLRAHLASLWSQASLWQNDDFTNWLAFDATACIAHLIELGASPADFAAHVRQLSEHVCSGNRDSCRNFLQKHYSWPE